MTNRHSVNFTVVGIVLLFAATLVALGSGPIPSLSANQPSCQSTPENRCCSCYTYDGEYRCHSGAYIGATYCDSGTNYCSRAACRSAPE